MTVTTQQRRRFDDDDDSDLYDPKYFPRKVVRDGGPVRVPMHLTDGRPDWMPPIRPALFDARSHQPHCADLSDASLQDGLRRAEDAYEARNRWLQDAWRGSKPPPGPRPGETARDAYVRRLQNAWKDGRDQPNEHDPDAAAEATLRQGEAWKTPGGAIPGERR
jgi:hypothetical protein